MLTSEVIHGLNVKLGLSLMSFGVFSVYTIGNGIITIEMFSCLNWNSILRLPKYPAIYH